MNVPPETTRAATRQSKMSKPALPHAPHESAPSAVHASRKWRSRHATIAAPNDDAMRPLRTAIRRFLQTKALRRNEKLCPIRIKIWSPHENKFQRLSVFPEPWHPEPSRRFERDPAVQVPKNRTPRKKTSEHRLPGMPPSWIRPLLPSQPPPPNSEWPHPRKPRRE